MSRKASQVRTLVLSILEQGGFKVGDKLPAESMLASLYGFSRPTVREGLASLVHEGVLTRRHGSGTFVTSLKPEPRKKVIAAMVPCIRKASGLHAEIARGAEDEADKNGYSLILCNFDNDPDKAMRYASRLAMDNVAGVVYAPTAGTAYLKDNMAVLDKFEKNNIPFVIMDSIIESEGGRFSFVGTNGFSAMREVVKHLVSLGHSRIAYIRYWPGVCSSDQRYFGFVEQIRKEHLSLPEEYVKTIKLESLEIQGREELRELACLDPRPTAVACIHDIVAKNVMEEARRIGLRVPEDLAVVGFDDLFFASHLTPPLTTVHQPLVKEGQIAARLLLQKIGGTFAGERQEFLDCELIVRNSCGAPPELRNSKRDSGIVIDTINNAVPAKTSRKNMVKV